jgi:hypothetical protein
MRGDGLAYVENSTNNALGFATNATEKMRVTAAGDVGIGTISPSAKLEVSTTLDEVARLTSTGSPFASWYAGATRRGYIQAQAGSFSIASDTAIPLILSTNATERMRIDSAGQVGIGTTPSAWVSSWRALDVNAGGGAIFSGLALSGIANNAYFDSGTNWRYKSSFGAATVSMASDGSVSINNAGAGTAGNIITFNTRVYVSPTGDVGIGTASPVSRFNVTGTAALNWVGSGTSSGLVTIGDQGTAGGSLFVNTPSLSTSFASGLGIDGSYTNPGGVGTSIVNIKAFGVSSGGGYGSDLAFHTAVGTTLSEKFRITSTGAITSSNLADAVGYKGIPQNSQTASYTLALSDMGKHISITTGGVVIPANGSVAFPIGSAVTIFNNSGSNQTISITTDTLRQAGTANTGSRTLAQYGVATVLKVTSTVWVISGAGVS